VGQYTGKGDTVTFTRRSPLTSRLSVQEIDVTPEQYYAWVQGTPIQDAMPHLTADEREFILNGMTTEDSETLARWAEAQQ